MKTSIPISCFLIACFLSLVLGIPNCVYAKSTYRIGVEEQGTYPIFDYRHDKKGYLSVVLEQFAKEQNIRFEYVPLPIERFFRTYEQNNIDFRFPDNPQWKAEDQGALLYSQPLIWVESNTVVRAKNQLKPADEIKIIGIVTGYTPSPMWRDDVRSGKVKLMEMTSPKLLTQSLYRDIVDGLDLNIAVVRHHASLLTLDKNQFVQLKTLPAPEFTFSLSTVKHSELLKKLDIFLHKNKQYISNTRKQFGL